MCLCIMPVDIFVSRLGITDLVNKMKMCTSLIKLLHFEIYIILLLFNRSVNKLRIWLEQALRPIGLGLHCRELGLQPESSFGTLKGPMANNFLRNFFIVPKRPKVSLGLNNKAMESERSFVTNLQGPSANKFL